MLNSISFYEWCSWATYNASFLWRRLRLGSAHENIPVSLLSSEYIYIYIYMWKFKINQSLSFKTNADSCPAFCRKLGTPNDDVWPGVTKFPFWNLEFPKFRSKGLRDALPNLDDCGYDLLQVTFCSERYFIEINLSKFVYLFIFIVSIIRFFACRKCCNMSLQDVSLQGAHYHILTSLNYGVGIIKNLINKFWR